MEDYKEKYEQALGRAKSLYEQGMMPERIEYIFPELKESEDERIRKSLIDFLDDVWHLGKDANFDKYSKADCAEWISWLKTQGEHANFRNKIQIGDEVTRNEDGVLVNLSQFKRMVKQGKQKPIEWDADDLLKRNQIITILKEYNRTDLIAWLEKQGEQKPADKLEPKFKVGDVVRNISNGDTVTITQIDKENQFYNYSGWDGAATVHSDFSVSEQDNWELVEQKPAWSEEDEMFVHGLIRGLAAKRDIHGHTTFSSDCIDITETITWLKSLKERMKGE